MKVWLRYIHKKKPRLHFGESFILNCFPVRLHSFRNHPNDPRCVIRCISGLLCRLQIVVFSAGVHRHKEFSQIKRQKAANVSFSEGARGVSPAIKRSERGGADSINRDSAAAPTQTCFSILWKLSLESFDQTELSWTRILFTVSLLSKR